MEQNQQLTETDTTLHFSSKGADSSSDFSETVSFSKEGKCNKIETMYGCDSCFQLNFSEILLLKRFKWRKIMEGMYISKFSKRLLFYKSSKHAFCYILQHNKYMTRTEYDNLILKIEQPPGCSTILKDKS